MYHDYFPLLKQYLLAYKEIYEHSYSKIIQIIDEFSMTEKDELCNVLLETIS